jgi:hypothetical protein
VLLLNDADFAETAEAQLILRISAIEALCPQPSLGPEYQWVIESLQGRLFQLLVDQEVKDISKMWLDEKRRLGALAALRKKFDALLPGQWSTFKKRLYDARSKLLHNGEGRGKLGNEATEARKIGVALLTADLKQRSS